ncbi:MAG: signal recognition particle receptor subunit alpha [Candidatus Aenigmatarchaeota archaeon]
MFGFLAKKIENIAKKIYSSKLDEKTINEILNEFKITLIESDVDLSIVNKILLDIKKEIKKSEIPAGLTYREFLIKVLYDKLVEILGKEKSSLIGKKRIMLVGLYGSGKTTTAAKLAYYFQKRGLKPLLVSLDFHRPAAIDQLKQLAESIHVDFFVDKDQYETAKKSLEFKKYDIIIYDTAGRDVLNKELANELKQLAEIIKPEEILLVIPAEIGKIAKKQAEEFHKLVGITGVIVTKVDSTAKAGGALNACSVTNAKVKFITFGEKINAIEEYDPKSFVSRMLGLGDLNSLLQKIKNEIKDKDKIEIEEFNFEEFLKQIQTIQNLGSFASIAKHIPFLGISIPEEIFEIQEEKMRKWKNIIYSMTIEERRNPEIINESRIKRIARGSGASEQEVRELISTFKKMQKLIKNYGKLMQNKQFANILRKFGIKF